MIQMSKSVGNLVYLMARPFMARVGTITAVFLAAKGVPPDLTSQFVTAGGVLAALAFEVGVVLWQRKY